MDSETKKTTLYANNVGATKANALPHYDYSMRGLFYYSTRAYSNSAKYFAHPLDE